MCGKRLFHRKLEFIFRGWCTIVMTNKKNHGPLEIKGWFLVERCADCNELRAEPVAAPKENAA
jgi:hypothetical protein